MALLQGLAPEWQAPPRAPAGASGRGGSSSGGGGGGGGGGLLGPVFSSFAGGGGGGDDAPANDAMTRLHQVCRDGDVAAVRALLLPGAAGGTTSNSNGSGASAPSTAAAAATSSKVDERDSQGCTALHWAADAGRLDVARCLLEECGADVDALDEEGQAPLHYAALCDHRAVCEYLLERGADGRIATRDGELAADLAPSAWAGEVDWEGSSRGQ